MKQEVFEFNRKEYMYQITNEIKELIAQGYTIEIVSHSTYEVGCSHKYNCIVIARKNQTNNLSLESKFLLNEGE